MVSQTTQQKKFEIKDIEVKDKDVYIDLCVPIEKNISINLMQLCYNLHLNNAKSLYFLLNSPGGRISNGVSLYNYLKNLPIKIHMHNMGRVNSIAIIVFLAGDHRYACPNSTFLFHAAEMPFQKKESINLKRLNEIKSELEKGEEEIKTIITENTLITKEEIERFFIHDQVSADLEFAKSKGIITDIKVPDIKRGCLHLKIDDEFSKLPILIHPS